MAEGHWLLTLLLVICSLLLQGEAVRGGGEAVRVGGEALQGGGEARPPCAEATSLTFKISTGFVLTASDHILLTQVKRIHPVDLLLCSVSDPDSNRSADPDSRQAKLVPQKQKKRKNFMFEEFSVGLEAFFRA